MKIFRIVSLLLLSILLVSCKQDLEKSESKVEIIMEAETDEVIKEEEVVSKEPEMNEETEESPAHEGDGEEEKVEEEVDEPVVVIEDIYSVYDHPNAYAVNHLVVMVDYNDYQTTMDDSFFENYYYGFESVGHRIEQSTRGQVIISPISVPGTNIQSGVTHVSLDINHPNSGDTYVFQANVDGVPLNRSEYYQLIIDQLDEDIDFSVFDENRDGYLSSREFVVTLIQPGYINNPRSEPTSFAHANLTVDGFHDSEYAHADGVKFLSYITLPEMIQKDQETNEVVNVKVFLGTHEFGHILNMKHVYSSRNLIGDGFGDPMGDGWYSDGNFSPWSMINVGLETPEEISMTGTYTMFSRTHQDYNILKIGTGESYYLIENIDLLGYDKGISSYFKNAGVGVWKIDEEPIVHKIDDQYGSYEWYEWPIYEGLGGRNSIVLDGPDSDFLYSNGFMRVLPEKELLYSINGVDTYQCDEFTLKVLSETSKEVEIEIVFNS